MLARIQQPKRVPAKAINAEEHPCMLDAEVRKQEQPPHRAH